MRPRKPQGGGKFKSIAVGNKKIHDNGPVFLSEREKLKGIMLSS